MNPEKRFYLREMEKLVLEPINAVRREINYLEEAGFLKAAREGKKKLFKVNKNFPFYSELKKIIYSSIGVGDYLKENLVEIENIDFAFIYGSVAKDEETVLSDIDMFLVGTVSERKLHKVVSDLEEYIGRDINYTLMSKQEFNKRRKNNDPFVRRILKENKIMLKGALNIRGYATSRANTRPKTKGKSL